MMNTPWRPSLEAVASCRTKGKGCEQRSEKKVCLYTPLREEAQPAECCTRAYGREKLLLFRQRILEASRLGDPAVDNGGLRCIQRRTKQPSPTFDVLKELSTDSICSTTDTLSDISDEHETSANAADLTSIGAPPGLDHPLQATASDFISSATLRASAPEFIPPATLRASAQEFVPSAISAILCAIDCQLEQHKGNVATDALGLAAQRSLEWRDYCGLASEPGVSALPRQFGNAHWQTALV